MTELTAKQPCRAGEQSSRAKCLRMLLVPILLGGCIGPTDPVESLIWEGSLMPVQGASLLVTGSVAIVSGQFNSQLGIGVEGVEPGVALRWNVRRGDCSAEGEPLANLSVFPPFVVGTSGEGSTGVVLSGRIPVTQDYAAWVSPSAQEASPVACAVLELQD